MKKFLLAAVILLGLVSPTFAHCLIIGDSIALGVSQQFPQCEHDAKVGISSGAVLNRVFQHPDNFDTVVVSVGSNDPNNPNLRQNLEMIRAKFRNAQRFVWIFPQNATAQGKMMRAATIGDHFIPFLAGPDHVHPRSYQAVASAIGKIS